VGQEVGGCDGVESFRNEGDASRNVRRKTASTKRKLSKAPFSRPQSTQKPLDRPNLRIASWNIKRGLFTKEEEIKELAKNESIDLLALLEVDLKDIDDKKPPQVEGFATILPLRRASDSKIRLLVLVREDLQKKVKTREDLMSGYFPSIWLEIETKCRKPLLVCFVYREWRPLEDKTIEAQLQALDILVQQISKAEESGAQLLIMGDMNLHQDEWDFNDYPLAVLADKIKDCLVTSGLEVMNVGKTYFADHKSRNGKYVESALDHIYTSESGNIKWKKLQNSASDHLPIFVEMINKQTKRCNKDQLITKRIFKHFDPALFSLDLSFEGWGLLVDQDDVDDKVELMEQFTTTVLNKHAPEKTFKPHSNYVPGLSVDTLSLMRKRDQARGKVRKCAGEEKALAQEEYKYLRNRCVQAVRRDAKQNVLHRFNGAKTSKDVWKATKSTLNPPKKEETELCVSGKTIDEPTKVAEAFNDFFLEKVDLLVKGIDQQNVKDPLTGMEVLQGQKDKFQLRTVSEQTVRKILLKMKAKASAGPDDISSTVIKAAYEVLVVPLTHIINASIVSGKFPSRWKHAKVVPLHKSGDKKNLKNYRPVSNLCVFSKILETVVHDQIANFCQENNVLPQEQHGFSRGKSTLTALVSMTDHWTTQVDSGKNVGVVLFDLSAAFDTLDRQILTKKLHRLGFGRNSITWLSSYLQGRFQNVTVDGKMSKEREVTVGVPQGSVLSPLLFNLYVSDMAKQIDGAKIHSYADDTTMTVSSDSMQTLVQHLEDQSRDVLSYMASNGLVANPSKTGLLIFRNQKEKKHPEVTIMCGDSTIKESKTEKVLGVKLSSSFKWTEQEKAVTNALRHKVFMLKRLASKLPQDCLIKVLDGLVMSAVRYCLPLWRPAGMNKNLSNCPIQVQLNNAIRVALGIKRTDKVSVRDLHELAGCQTLDQMTVEATAALSWKILKGQCEGLKTFYEQTTINSSTVTVNTRSMNRCDLRSAARTVISQNTFRHSSTLLWNKLPNSVRSLGHVNVPKGQIREFVVNQQLLK
jgi:exonuclease III